MDPSIYLMDDENKLPTDVSAKVEESNSLTSDKKNVIQKESNSSIDCGSHTENRNCSPRNVRTVEGNYDDLLNKVSDCLEAINIAESVSDDKGFLSFSIMPMYVVPCLDFRLPRTILFF